MTRGWGRRGVRSGRDDVGGGLCGVKVGGDQI